MKAEQRGITFEEVKNSKYEELMNKITNEKKVIEVDEIEEFEEVECVDIKIVRNESHLLRRRLLR
jgi:hypothetical protein